MKYVVFRVGAERYALPVEAVKSIEELPTIRQVPRPPEHVVGVTNLRGTIVTVLSLHSIQQIAEPEQTEETRVLVTDTGAYIVDAAQDVIEINENEIEPWNGSSQRVKGVCSRNTEFILVLDSIEEREASTSA